MTGGGARGVMHIAAHEVRRYTGELDRRSLLVIIVSLVLLAVLWPAATSGGVHPEEGIYVVEADRDAVAVPIARSTPAFDVVEDRPASFARGEADLLLTGEQMAYRDGDGRSEAAARELELATMPYLDDVLATEADQDAAFPVRVNLVYVLRSPEAASRSVGPADDRPPIEDPGTLTPPRAEPELIAEEGAKQLALSPSEVDPPFPIRSLLLTFAYLVPLNFLTQLYAGSLYGERVRHRGVLLISSPYTGGQVLLGKSLPYVAVTAVAAVAVTFAVGANLVGLVAAVPILAFALASSLLLALVSPSPRSLTFSLVTVTVLLSTFLFLPAIFTNVHPVSFLSPVTVIAATIRGETVGLGSLVYATAPLTLVSACLVALSVPLYREESLFAPRGTTSKVLDGIGRWVRSKRGLFAAGVLAVPFAIGLEVFVLIFAVTLDLRIAFVVFLFGSAFVEEMLKGLPAYAHAQRGRHARRRAWVVGALIGGGFFVGEKGALAFSLIGLGLLPQGPETLATFGIASSLVLVLAPLALHVVTVTITATGARRGRKAAMLAVFAAVLVHATYNAAILFFALGGLT